MGWVKKLSLSTHINSTRLARKLVGLQSGLDTGWPVTRNYDKRSGLALAYNNTTRVWVTCWP